MAIKKQLISIPIGDLKMNTDIDQKLNPGISTSFDSLYNRVGAISKRYGSAKVVATTFDDGIVASYKDNPIIVGDSITTTPQDFDGTYYSRTYNNTAKFLEIDSYGVGHEEKDVWFYCDLAETGNIVAVAYTTKNQSDNTYGLFVECFDKITGIRLDGLTIMDGQSRINFCKLAKIGEVRLSFYYINSAGVVYNGTINPSTGIISTASAVTNAPAASTTNSQFDLCVVWKDTTHPYVVLTYPAAANDYSFCVISCSGGDSTADYYTTDNHTTDDLKSVAIFPQKDYDDDGYSTVLVQFASTAFNYTFIYANTYDYECNEVVTAAAIDFENITDGYALTMSGVATSDTTATAYICWNSIDYNDIPFIKKAGFLNTSGTGSNSFNTTIHQRARLATKIVREAETSHHYYGVFTKSWGYDYGVQDELLWSDKDENIIGKSFVGKARVHDTIDAYNVMPNVQVYDDDGYKFTTCMATLIYDDNALDNKDLYQIRRLRINSKITEAPSVVETPIGCFIANACPYELDNSRVHEAGFLQYPEPFSLTATSGTGLEDGYYHYYLCYEWTDSTGIRHRSSPSPEIGAVECGSGNNKVTIVCPTLTFTRKSSVQIAVYRTKVGPTTRFYRVGSVENSTTQPTINYIDDTADEDIEENEAIYTTGNVLPNIQPFSCEIALYHQNRLFYVDRENKRSRIYYTKEFNFSDSAGYSDVCLISCDPAGGNITALASLLDKIIIFKKDRIFASDGEGLTATGGGSNFRQPYLISPNIGCINKHSIVQIPSGIMFQASDNIWLLNNSLQLSPLGDPITHYMDATVKGVGKDNENNLVKFYTDGYGLIYNWDRDKWNIWNGRACVSAAYMKENTYWLDSSGYLWSENTATFTDASADINQRVDTGWFSFANIGGYQRVYRVYIVGQKRSNCKLRVRLGYDYDGYYSDVQTFDTKDITAFDHSLYFTNGSSSNDGEHFVLQVFTRNPRCASIRVSVEEYDPSGAGIEISTIAFLVGVESESIRLPNGKTFNGV